MFGGHLQISKKAGLLSISHLHSNLFDCDDVLDIVLDQTRSCASPCNTRSDQFAYLIHAACKQPKILATRQLYQGIVLGLS